MINFLRDLDPHLAARTPKAGRSMFESPANTSFGTLTVRSSWIGIWTDDEHTKAEIGRGADDLRRDDSRDHP